MQKKMGRDNEHLNQNEIAAILNGSLVLKKERACFRHWKSCPECRVRLSEYFTGAGTFAPVPTAEHVRLYNIASNPAFHVACSDAAVVAAAFSLKALHNTLPCAAAAGTHPDEDPFSTELVSRLTNYFTFGTPFGRIPVHLISVKSAFMNQVLFWTWLIPPGETVSYGAIASWLGRPGAARAVGQALHRNPVPLIIPCHRVLGKDGQLMGFGAGIGLKRHLLQLEGHSLKS
ncbi:MAG: methylated-DNA--[protein]-cysteine S-methyltransferase [Fidelibacterota bacterium]